MIDGLDAATIVRDVAANTPPQRSKLKYTREMLAYRHVIEKEWEAWRRDNPKATLEVPPDIDGLPNDEERMDEWNPDQPRDEFGKFAPGGEGTEKGLVKSAQSAIGKAESKSDLKAISNAIHNSKTASDAAKAKVYQALSQKAAELPGNSSYAESLGEIADEYAQAAGISLNETSAEPDNAEIDEEAEYVKTNSTKLEKLVEMSGSGIAKDKISDFQVSVEGKQINTAADALAAAQVYQNLAASSALHGLPSMADGFEAKAAELKAQAETMKTPTDQEEAKIAEKAAKPQAALDHAKEAREHAKSIIAHAKGLRDKLKADPNNEDLKKQVALAEKSAKAARAAARKAEKASSPEEAAKYAAASKGHAEKAGVKMIGTSVPTVTKASAVEPSVKSTPVGKSNKPKVEVVKPGAVTKISKSSIDEVQQTVANLKKAATETPPPANWSDAKKEAYAKAVAALDRHGGAKTIDEFKAAAEAFDKVAKEVVNAGSYWGGGYQSLANKMQEATTASNQEKFIVHPPTGKVDVKTHAPVKSARPIDDIKGEEVHEETFKEHRSQYTAILSADEKSAALVYSGSAYSSINKHLRSDKPPTPQMKNLDAAIAKSPAPRDMIVNRGMSGEKAKELFGSLKPGDQIHEKAYWSTSAGGNSAFGGDVEVKITVPKGYPVAPIPSHHPGEREYLLRRNSRMQVTKVEKAGFKIVAHVTVIHDEQED